jgi:hypothetical protein
MNANPLIRISLAIGALFFWGCNRAVEETADVVFVLPNSTDEMFNSQSNKSTFVSNLTLSSSPDLPVSSASESDGNNQIWDTRQVKFLSELNCFFVIADTPGTNSLSCKKIESITPEYFFSTLAGPTRLSSSLTMKVNPGKARKFYLFGMKTDDPKKYCKLLTDSGFRRSFLSRPYMVGQSDVVDLTAGVETTVKITTDSQLDQSKYVDQCDLSAIDSRPEQQQVGLISARIKDPLFGQTAVVNQCVPYRIQFFDNSIQYLMPSPFSQKFRITKTDDGDADSFDNLMESYEDPFDCLDNEDGDTEFSTKNLSETVRWVKMPSDGKIGINTVNTTNSMISDVISIGGAEFTFANKENNASESTVTRRVFMQVPEKIINDVCTPLTISGVNMDFTSNYNIPQGGLSIAASAGTLVENQTITFFDNQNCENSGSSNSYETNFDSDAAQKVISFKLTGFPQGKKISFILNHSSSLKLGKYETEVVNGDSTLSGIKIIGPEILFNPTTTGGSAKCFGPFKAYLTNSSGGYIRLNTGTQALSIFAAGSDATNLYPAVASGHQCTGGLISALPVNSKPAISNVNGYYEFYVKVTKLKSDIDSSIKLKRYVTAKTTINGSIKMANHLLVLASSDDDGDDVDDDDKKDEPPRPPCGVDCGIGIGNLPNENNTD